MRGARPQAIAALPSLQAQPQPIIAPHAGPSPYANGHANGNHHYVPHAAPNGAPPPMQPIQVAKLHDAAQPILPPRPTGRMHSATARQSTGWWKSWPVVVIILAALAIVAAVVLMVWPPGGSSDKGSTGLKPPPAPERMDTSPLPPPPSASNGTTPKAAPADPWPGPAPTQPRKTAPPSIDIPDDPDPSNPGAGGSGNSAAMMTNILKHACDRFKACGVDDDTMATVCETALRSAPSMPAPSCAAARRCLSAVDAMSCSAVSDPTDAMSLANQLSDCADAMRC